METKKTTVELLNEQGSPAVLKDLVEGHVLTLEVDGKKTILRRCN